MSYYSSIPLDQRRTGRGAVSNHQGRYEVLERQYQPDGWDEGPRDDALLRTQTSLEVPRRVISYNRSPDLPFDRSINPYR